MEIPEGCQLGCVDRSCHSHSPFGLCNYEVDWMIPYSTISDAEVQELILFKGDTRITFRSFDRLYAQFAHNVYSRSPSWTRASSGTGRSWRRWKRFESAIRSLLTLRGPFSLPVASVACWTRELGATAARPEADGHCQGCQRRHPMPQARPSQASSCSLNRGQPNLWGLRKSALSSAPCRSRLTSWLASQGDCSSAGFPLLVA